MPLNLAQKVAYNLAITLMVTVVLLDVAAEGCHWARSADHS